MKAPDKILCEPKGSAKKVFNKFWKEAKTDACDRKTLASISFDAGHSLRHDEYEKAFWWYNLPLSKKKSLFDKRFLDDEFDMNKIHKEIITILYELCCQRPKTKEIIFVNKIIEDFKLTGQTIHV